MGSQKAQNWLSPRQDQESTKRVLREVKSVGRPIVLAFASSAGEYEQILPVIHQLISEGWSALVCFFSPSGIKFAKARRDEIPYVASPLDTVWHVNSFFDALKPDIVLVSKQELWPCFLWAASERSSLFLVDASVSERMLKRRSLFPFSKYISMYSLFHGVFCVSQKDYDWFIQFGLSPKKLEITGDTKFDRAHERLQSSKEKRESICEDWKRCFGDHHTFVVGSAWPEDVLLVMSALKLLKQEISVALVPHDTSPEMCLELARIVESFGYRSLLYSKRHREPLPGKEGREVIIVDQLGLLFEMYDLASWAWVGGALHHQVHNVLEPAIRGTPTAFGLRFTNSQEARDLIAEGVAFATNDANQLAHWIHSTPPKWDENLVKTMQNKMGASERIHEILYDVKIRKMNHNYLQKLR
ncbi:MAG: glycosyltransferase N-terminal domain-containing protein [Pseudomonadota bacterium]